MVRGDYCRIPSGVFRFSLLKPWGRLRSALLGVVSMLSLSRVRARLVPVRLRELVAGRTRPRTAVLGLIILALLAGVASAAVLVSEVLDTPEAEAAECVSEKTASTPEVAHALAVQTGCDVEILDRRTSWDTYFATPASTTRHVRTASAQQVVDQASGEWVPVSAEIVESDKRGVLGVRAGAFDFEFRSGRVAAHVPFATMTDDDGAAVSVALPAALGPAKVDGQSVSWPVLDADGGQIVGATVATSMYTDTSGMVPVLKLDSPEAAEQVKLAAGDAGISFAMSTSAGVEWRPREAGGFEALEVASGEVTLVSPAPRHWDSSGSVPSGGSSSSDSLADERSADQTASMGSRSKADSGGGVQEIPAAEEVQRLTEPLTADLVEPMGTRLVAPNKFTATANLELLRSAEASWPQFIDPPVSNDLVHWTMIQNGWPDATDWDFGKGASTPLGRSEGLGLCDVDNQYGGECNRDNVKRLIWQFNWLGEFDGASEATDLDSEEIISATFQATGTWSYDCSDRDVQAFRLPDISSTTTWRNYSFRFTEDETRKQQLRRVHHKSGCPEGPQPIDFSVTDAARIKADGDQTTMAIGLMALNEDSMVAWKKYAGETAKLEIEASYAPTISGAKTGNAERCTTDPDNKQWIGKAEESSGVLVKAVPADYDTGSVKVRFSWRKAGSTGEFDSRDVTGTAGQEASTRLPTDLGEGYNSWYATAVDTSKPALTSSSLNCHFYVDTIAPNAPTITSEPPPSIEGAVTEYEEGLERGGKNQKGCFKFDRNGSTDVGHIEVHFNNVKVTTLTMTGDTAVKCLTPAIVGPQTVKAVSIDRAGNEASNTYSFYVAQAREDGIWSFDEASTSEAADKTRYDASAAEALPAGKLLFNGPTKIAGPHAEWGSRSNDKALRFDGINDYAYSEAWRPVFDTTNSFVVSAHVRLGSSASATGWYTAVSQLGYTATGAGFEGFRIGYRPAGSGTTACPTASAAPGALGGCWTFILGENHQMAVRSPVPVKAGEWVHLVGEYDKGSTATGDEMARIWACQVGTAASPSAGKPVRSEVKTAPSVKSGGSFVVGRGYPGGNGSNWFNGDIDNVRIFRGDVLAESKVRRMCQGAEAWQTAGLEEDKFLNPTIAE